MALGDIFKLTKLKIEAYEKEDRQDPIKDAPPGGPVIEVMYNPETLTIGYSSVYQEKDKRWLRRRASTLSVKLIFDGTNVSHFGVELLFGVPTVAERVKDFLGVCFTTQPETHEPAFLRLKWGEGVFDGDAFDCRLQSVNIQYTLFDRDGAPLRAELTAEFAEALDPTAQKAKERHASPDLTHRRVVRSGDTLPLLCREIYGSAHHYVRVAQVNGLDDFRALVPGQELIFPPFARKERR